MARRRPLAARRDLTAYRLVNGAGDGYPGLVVDRLDDVLVLNADHQRIADRALAEAHAALSISRTAYVKLHPPRASRPRPDDRLALAPPEPAWGEPVDRVVVRENGVDYVTRPAAGLATGLFLDMREVRAWVRDASKGQNVLNLFAYTCAFGVCAARGGARGVVNLDLSRGYLTWGQENYTLNGLAADPKDFVYGDALDWLGRFGRRSQAFGMVIVDPPSFSSTQRGTFAAARDYPRLAKAAARVVAPGGILLAATNHAGISNARFDALLARGVSGADRHGQLLRSWHEPAIDFPVAPGSAPYLKVRALVLE